MIKPHSITNPKYLAFVRLRPCLVPGCPLHAEANHLITRRATTNDYTAIPLCHHHHAEYHQMGRKTFPARYNVDLWKEAWASLLAFHLQGDQ